MIADLINLADYTVLEHILFAVGCLMWVVVYGIYAVRAVRKLPIAMPVIAACANFGWEIVWSFVPPDTDMGIFYVYLYRAWFVLDVFIFIGILRYGTWQIHTESIRRYRYPIFVITCLFFFLLFAFMKTSTVLGVDMPAGFDMPIGANSAYICQMLISALFVWMFVKSSPYERNFFSETVTWLRTIGTGLNDVVMFIHYPDNHFLHVMAVSSFLLDLFFIFLFYRLPREKGPLPKLEHGNLPAAVSA